MIISGLILTLTICLPAQADIYRWKDANGVTHFSNEPPPPGAVVIETIEEAPYDAEQDHQRIQEERRLRLERQKLELEERKAGLAAREREAQLQLDEAERRLYEAQQLEQRSLDAANDDDDCNGDYYLRYGRCGDPAYGYRYYHGRPGHPNLYRGYYRENNNLYYKAPHRPGHPPGPKPPHRPGVPPTPKTDRSPDGTRGKKPPAAVEDPALKGALSPPVPAAPK
jgi:type II secretory pathway component PulJ